MLLTASKVLGITEVLDILNCILSTDKKKKGTQSTSPGSNNLVKVSCRHTLHISIPLGNFPPQATGYIKVDGKPFALYPLFREFRP